MILWVDWSYLGSVMLLSRQKMYWTSLNRQEFIQGDVEDVRPELGLNSAEIY